MISPALEFIHARKWLVELILLAVIVGAAWWFCQHLIGVGVQRQKDADAQAYLALQRKADIETGRLQGKADAAEHAHDQELTDLRQYRADHPLHGGLCLKPKLPTAADPKAATADSRDAGARTATGDLQPVPEGSAGLGRQPEADVRHLLDVLAGRADLLSGTVREFQGRGQ